MQYNMVQRTSIPLKDFWPIYYSPLALFYGPLIQWLLKGFESNHINLRLTITCKHHKDSGLSQMASRKFQNCDCVPWKMLWESAFWCLFIWLGATIVLKREEAYIKSSILNFPVFMLFLERRQKNIQRWLK